MYLIHFLGVLVIEDNRFGILLHGCLCSKKIFVGNNIQSNYNHLLVTWRVLLSKSQDLTDFSFLLNSNSQDVYLFKIH